MFATRKLLNDNVGKVDGFKVVVLETRSFVRRGATGEGEWCLLELLFMRLEIVPDVLLLQPFYPVVFILQILDAPLFLKKSEMERSGRQQA